MLRLHGKTTVLRRLDMVFKFKTTNMPQKICNSMVACDEINNVGISGHKMDAVAVLLLTASRTLELVQAKTNLGLPVATQAREGALSMQPKYGLVTLYLSVFRQCYNRIRERRLVVIDAFSLPSAPRELRLWW